MQKLRVFKGVAGIVDSVSGNEEMTGSFCSYKNWVSRESFEGMGYVSHTFLFFKKEVFYRFSKYDSTAFFSDKTG